MDTQQEKISQIVSQSESVVAEIADAKVDSSGSAQWSADAMKELGKIPFFVRGKARRNTDKFAQEQGMHVITLETLYDAKAHYSR